MNNYKEVIYFTLQDCIGEPLFDNPFGGAPLADIWNAKIKTILPVLQDTNVAKLWKDYIKPTYYDTAIVVVENEDDKDKAFEKWLYKLVAVINLTIEKYVPVIDQFEAAKTKLMADVKQTSTARFNDTPQTSGNYIDTAYTSNISVNEVSSQGGTTAVRLAEVKAAWENIYYEWSKEFSGLFIVG